MSATERCGRWRFCARRGSRIRKCAGEGLENAVRLVDGAAAGSGRSLNVVEVSGWSGAPVRRSRAAP
jgi:hypothetical protein